MRIEDPTTELGEPSVSPLAPRVDSLEGTTVGLYDNGKMAAEPVLEVLQAKLDDEYDDLEFREFHLNNKQEIADPTNQERVREWARQDIDVCIGATGDCGSCTKYLTWGLTVAEEEGVPSVGLIDEGFELDWQTNAIERGMALRYIKGAVKAEVREKDLIADQLTTAVMEEIEAELTRPLSENEQGR